VFLFVDFVRKVSRREISLNFCFCFLSFFVLFLFFNASLIRQDSRPLETYALLLCSVRTNVAETAGKHENVFQLINNMGKSVVRMLDSIRFD
jgi:hypothetical protein